MARHTSKWASMGHYAIYLLLGAVRFYFVTPFSFFLLSQHTPLLMHMPIWYQTPPSLDGNSVLPFFFVRPLWATFIALCNVMPWTYSIRLWCCFVNAISTVCTISSTAVVGRSTLCCCGVLSWQKTKWYAVWLQPSVYWTCLSALISFIFCTVILPSHSNFYSPLLY